MKKGDRVILIKHKEGWTEHLIIGNIYTIYNTDKWDYGEGEEDVLSLSMSGYWVPFQCFELYNKENDYLIFN